ncbi:MAG: hypothetical protein LUC34_01040 [Campylobacter sp.]|nr:hypothetical protein [Campylobacter sp.]
MQINMSYEGYTSVSHASSQTNILVSSDTDKKEIVREVQDDKAIKDTVIKKSNESELKENLQTLQDKRTQIAHQISNVENLNDKNSVQTLQHLNIAQADIETNILSVKTKISEILEA